ncbi:MAG: sulfatase [Thermoanaerobaculia bacterium]
MSGHAMGARCLLALGALLTTALACAGQRPESPGAASRLRPTRGYILISLDTLGAAHLGAYGSDRPTSPFFDSLAERGILFENAFVQYPSTLVSHMSLFTGLYPQQHGVYPPSYRLSPAIATLPEQFSQGGFRTAGHTEGGFVGRGYGFARGFDEFTDPRVEDTTDIERTFEKGLSFLRRLGAEDRFFLFLHTYSIHDPYQPPEPYASMFSSDEPPGPRSKLPIGQINAGHQQLGRAEIDYFEALYDGGIRYADEVLAGFFAELGRLGLEEKTTVVITSDHGEEFLEHHRVGHTQLYPETLHVPLLVLHPDQRAGRRVPEVVQSIDIAPTLLELAGLPRLEAAAGRSLTPLLEGDRPAPGAAYAEVLESYRQESLIERRDGRLLQAVETAWRGERGGTWITRRVEFDWSEPVLEVSLASFYRPRRLTVIVDGEPLTTLEVGTSWSRRTLELPAGGPSPRRIGLATPGCDSPKALGMSEDGRCLSIKVRGIELRRRELFDLEADRAARNDLARTSPESLAELAAELDELVWESVTPPVHEDLGEAEAEALRALGYIE